MSRFHILTSSIISYRNATVQAVMHSPLDWDTTKMWYLTEERIADRIPALRFAVKRRNPHPDLYFTGTTMELLSSRFADLLDSFGVPNERIRVELTEDVGGPVLADLNYWAVRPTKILPYLDARRDAENPDCLVSLKTDDALQVGEWALFRDKTLFTFFLVREDLKAAIEEAGFSGCAFQTLEQYVGDSQKRNQGGRRWG